MKQCPNCKTTYTDETLSFCLVDGAKLISLSNSEETPVLPFDKNSPPHLTDSSPTIFPSANSYPTIAKKNTSLFVAALIGFLLLAILGLAASVGYFLLRSGENKITVTEITVFRRSKSVLIKLAIAGFGSL